MEKIDNNAEPTQMMSERNGAPAEPDFSASARDVRHPDGTSTSERVAGGENTRAEEEEEIRPLFPSCEVGKGAGELSGSAAAFQESGGSEREARWLAVLPYTPGAALQRAKGKMPLEQSGRAQQCDGERELPTHLVEEIVSRTSFPAVFNARLLSRAWLAKLPVRAVAPSEPSLQNLISAQSFRWTTYCPCYFTEDDSILCFDRESSRWKRMLCLSYLPQHFSRCMFPDLSCEYTFTTAGSLLCMYHLKKVLVVNLVTRTWNELPTIPFAGDIPKDWLFRGLPLVRVLSMSAHRYKVVIIFSFGETYVYDSGDGGWTRLERDVDWAALWFLHGRRSAGLDRSFSSSALARGGKLCCLIRNFPIPGGISLRTFTAENDEWSTIVPLELPPSVFNGGIVLGSKDKVILGCKDKVIVAMGFAWPSSAAGYNCIGLLQLDVENLQLREEWPGPNAKEDELRMHDELYRLWKHVGFASDDNFIYVGPIGHLSRQTVPLLIMAYNLNTRAWSRLPPPPRFHPAKSPHTGRRVVWNKLAFQPGLHPFMSV